MSQEECIICFSEMPIPIYEENTTDGVIYQGEVSRLQCGHAYHTQCILTSLQHRSICPLCNVGEVHNNEHVRDGEWIDRRLFLHERCKEVLRSVKKTDKLRECINEHKEKLRIFNSNVKEFKNRLKEFKKNFREEFDINNKIKEIKKLQDTGSRLFKIECKKQSTLVNGAVSTFPRNKLTGMLFGESARFFRWRNGYVFK